MLLLRVMLGHGRFPRGGRGEVAGDLLAAVGHRVGELRVPVGGAGLGPGTEEELMKPETYKMTYQVM